MSLLIPFSLPEISHSVAVHHIINTTAQFWKQTTLTASLVLAKGALEKIVSNDKTKAISEMINLKKKKNTQIDLFTRRELYKHSNTNNQP